MHGKEVKGLETRENTGNQKSRIPLRHDFQQQFPSTKPQTTITFRWLLSSEHFIQYKSLYKTKNLKSHRGFYLRDGRHASPWSRRTPAVLVLLVCIPRTIQIRRYHVRFRAQAIRSKNRLSQNNAPLALTMLAVRIVHNCWSCNINTESINLLMICILSSRKTGQAGWQSVPSRNS